MQFLIPLTIRCFLPEEETFTFEVFMVFCNIRIFEVFMVFCNIRI